MSAIEIVGYDEKLHRNFVVGTFIEMALATWPWSALPIKRNEDRFLRELRAPDSRALVAKVPERWEADSLYGWMVTKPHLNEIVAGYVMRPYRRHKERVGSTLAGAAGVDLGKPVGVWFWTYACERMFLAHPEMRLYHKVCD